MNISDAHANLHTFQDSKAQELIILCLPYDIRAAKKSLIAEKKPCR